MTKLEHVNLTVPCIDEALKFLLIVAPDFKIRKDSTADTAAKDNYRWVHIGNDEYYLALQEAHLEAKPKKQLAGYINYGVNHIALVVSNIAIIEGRLKSNGFRKSIKTPLEKFRKRVYYYDHAGFEWELIEYFSTKPQEKFLYE